MCSVIKLLTVPVLFQDTLCVVIEPQVFILGKSYERALVWELLGTCSEENKKLKENKVSDERWTNCRCARFYCCVLMYTPAVLGQLCA